jgi:hypothetical protein
MQTPTGPGTPAGRASLFKRAAICVVLAAGIVLPLAGTLLGSTTGLLNEKRRLAEFPPLRLRGKVLGQFPEKFEAYFNDHFPFRGVLIRWNNLAKLRLLGVSPQIIVTLGRQNWLFLTYEHAGDNPRKSRPFSPAELRRCQDAIESQARWLAEHDARYILLFTPDKQTVYPELYPRKRSIRLDQLLAHMQAHSAVPVPDLRGPLRQAREEHQVYYRTDSHWNDYGAHVAYRTVGELLHEWYPQVTVAPLSDFKSSATLEPKYAQPYLGDLPAVLGFPELYVEAPAYLKPRGPRRAHKTDEVIPMNEVQRLCGFYPYATEQDNPALPRAVILHDSFGVRLAPFLAEYFRRAVFVPESWFDQDIIAREHPDVVIFQLVERKLEYFVAPDPEPPTR